MGDMLTLYMKYWRPFGELLTDMEKQGIMIDREHLRRCELQAINEAAEHENTFLAWVYSTQEDAADYNASSVQQMQQLLFAPYAKKMKQSPKKGKKEVNDGKEVDWAEEEAKQAQ